MTLTNCEAVLLVQKAVKISTRKWANGGNMYDFEREIDTGVIATLPWVYKLVYDHYSQANLLVFISDLKLAFTGPLVLYGSSVIENNT